MLARCWRRWLDAAKAFQNACQRTRSAARFRPWLESLESRVTPVTINLTPSADDTLYQDPGGQLSNGAGQHFYAGATNQNANAIRRGAVKFNLSAVPAGAIVTSAVLTFHMSKSISGAEPIALHPALKNWGEGTSNAARGNGGEGAGTSAATGDVTWLFTFFNSQRWTSAGGDFGAVSASASVGGVGSYQWSGTGVTADVQQWVNNPAGNFGWIITGNESGKGTAKEFDTKENSNAAFRPVLTVTYSQPVPDLAIAKSHTGSFHHGDAAATYTLTVGNVGSGPTSGVVTVTDALPAGLAPTAADSGTINGWAVSASGQTVSATRSDVLAAGQSYPGLTLTVTVADNAPASVTNTAVVSGGGQTNTANDSASDPTPIIDAADLTITKSHTGNFKQGDSAATYTLTVKNIGLGPTIATVTVVDTLPQGLAPTAADSGTVNGWTLSTSGQTITATRSDVLGSGASYPPLSLTVSVSLTAPASLANSATVAGGGELNTPNDSASDPTTITQVADLTIAKSHTGTFRAGDSADTYTVLVSNVGAAPTDGSPVTVIDTLPPGLAPTAADSGTVKGWTVSFSGQTITATRRDVLNAGVSYPPLAITVSVANNVALFVTNTVAVSGGGEVNTANDTASDPTPTTPVADLTISKSHTGSFRQGDAADGYTLTVSNVGPVASAGTVTVTDTLPAGLTPAAANRGTINGWTISVTGPTIAATRSDVLASGGAYPALVLTVAVTNDAPASLTNTVIVSGGGELNTTNDTAEDITSITQVADLTITMSHAGSFTAGATGAYTVTVSNTGRGAITAPVTVVDVLPAGLTYAGPDAVNGWTISVTGQTVTATRSDVLASGASYESLTLIVKAAALAPVSVANTVTVSGGGEVNVSNDVASDVTTILASEVLRRRRGA